MATRFAVMSGNWSSGATWDNGNVPTSADDVYANGYTIQLNTDVNVNTLRVDVSNVRLCYMNVPKMLSNTFPSGYIASASTNATSAYLAFDQVAGQNFNTGTINNWVSFQYPSPKLNVRYSLTFTAALYPQAWRYEGSNDGANYTTLHTVTGNSLTTYYSPLLTFTTPYSYYRIFVTAQIYAPGAYIESFEMTEDTNPNPIYGANGGGTFNNTTTRNIILNGSNGGLFATTNQITITAAHNTPDILSITSTYGIIATRLFTLGVSSRAIFTTGTGTLNITGDLYNATNVSQDQTAALYVNSNATVNINGNLFGGASSTVGALLTSSSWVSSTITINGNITPGTPHGNSYAITLNGTGRLNIIGSVNGSSSSATAINVAGNPTVTITGNLTSAGGGCYTSAAASYLTVIGNITYNNASSVTPITLAGASTLTITGNITAPPSSPAISCGAGAVTINVPTGVVIAGTNAVGISAPSATLVTVFGPLINTNNTMAVYANRLRFYSGTTTTQWRFQDTANATRVLYQSGYTGTTIGLPASIDVRKNTVYGQYNEFTGTLVVPSPSDVRINVLTDNTVGTGQLTAEDFLNAITASTLPIAIRLQNISTTQTMGTQLAALSGRT